MALTRTLCRAAVAAAACSGLAPAAASARVELQADPALKPPFSQSIPDYVSRCVPGEPLRFSGSATGGDSVAIGSGPKKTGSFTAQAATSPGARIVAKVTSGGRTRNYNIRCLPPNFPEWRTERNGTPQSQFYVLTPSGPHREGYAIVFDTRGTPIWWWFTSGWAPWDAKLLDNGNLIWSRQFLNLFGVRPEGAWEEHTLSGKTVRTLQTVDNPTDMHDLEQLPNGNFLLDAYRPRCCVDLRKHGGLEHSKVYDAEIQELTPAGKLVWKWNSKGRISPDETLWWKDINDRQDKRPPAEREYDLVHINSVEPDGSDGILFSSRFTNALWRIDKTTKKITWKLGGTKRKESLAIKNDPRGDRPLGGNHDMRRYRDGTITVFDNATGTGHAPRAARYRIDTGKRTATLVEAFGDGDVPGSGWGGSTRKLAGGNWVTYWGGTLYMTEHTANGRKRVLLIKMGGDRYSYRAFPIPHGKITARALRRGMDAMPQPNRAGTAR